MLSITEKRTCDDKLYFLCSDAIKGIVIGWCSGLTGEQKAYILNRLLNELCISLQISRAEVKDDSTVS